MNIYTSYFGNLKNIPGTILPVSIARFSPGWFNGPRMDRLAPSKKLLWGSKQGRIDAEEYTARYMAEITEQFDPPSLVQTLEKEFPGQDIALLCYEKKGEFCHRRLVAEWLGEHTRTLERWRKRFTDNGLDGLIDETSPGRPPKLSAEEWKRLRAELSRPPATYGLDGKKWQGKLLQDHLARHYGIDFSLRQCQRLLKQYRQGPADVSYKTNAAAGYISSREHVGIK